MAIDIQRDRRIGMTCDSADSQYISARGYCLADCGISELMESNLADLGLGKGWSKNPLHEITMSEVSALLRLEYWFAFGGLTGSYSYPMGILVTGGAGFIGGHTLRQLQKEYPNTQIRCLDNLSTGYRNNIPKGIELIEGDVCDFRILSGLINDSLDGVIHLAADSRVLPSLQSPNLAKKSLESNLNGTLNVLTAILETGKRIPFVYAGSSTAYGDHKAPQGEDLLPRVQSPYSAGKLAGEMMIRSYVITFGLWATTLRYFQVYGPGQPSEGSYALVTGIFLSQAKEGAALTIEGDGSQSRDFVHVFDVARANVSALKIDGKGEPINIGTGKSHTVKNLADMLSPNQVFLPPRKIDLPATQSTTRRAKELLSWESTITLEDGMTELLNMK